jgi:hypothetical protein
LGLKKSFVLLTATKVLPHKRVAERRASRDRILIRLPDFNLKDIRIPKNKLR